MRPLKNLCEVAVIGGGLAGLTAAHHAARLGALVTLFEVTGMYGGLVATVDHVDGLAVPGKFSGQDLAIHLLEDARKIGVRVLDIGIESLTLGKRLTLRDHNDESYQPKAIVVASGASLRKLDVPGEAKFTGRGVSRCATCDGGFFRNQDVAVVGGGDAAVHEALVLARTSQRVTMICRSALRAKRDYADKLAARENVDFVWDSEVSEILGDNGVSGVRVRNLKTGVSSELECAGVFPFIGVTPNSNFVPASLLDASGYIKTDAQLASSDPRLFAVGAVRAGYGGNIVEAMAEGISAAHGVARLLLH